MRRAFSLVLSVWFAACSSAETPNGRGADGGAGSGAPGGSAAATAGSGKQVGTGAGGQAAGASGGPLGGGGASPEANGGMAGDGNDAGAGGSGEPAPCDAQHPSGCPRGLYLSLWADHNGQNTFAGDTLPHLHILGDAEKETPVLDFISAHGITSLSLYDLDPILSDASRTAALEAFLEKARVRGVREVLAISDTTQAAWDQIATEQRKAKPFDGFVTEIEFWADNSFDTFKTTLAYVHGLNVEGRSGGAMPIASYIGWPSAEQMNDLAPLVDRLFIHAYVTSPDKAFGYVKQRLLDLAAANTAHGTHVEVRPIFSAEGTTWAAGAEHFMGDWLGQHSLPEAESALLAAWAAEPPGSLPPFGGFQYFEYFYLERYVP